MAKKYYSGFTLIELIIVIGLIVFLVLMGMIYFRSQIFKGNDAKRKADIHLIQTAVEEYEKDHDCYPQPQQVVCDPGTGLVPYIDKIPCDPVSKASYYYDYQNDACPSWYRLFGSLDIAGSASFGPGNAFDYYVSSPNAPDENLTESTTQFYGCKNYSCTPIFWDNDRPGPECDPNFQSATCYGQCGSAQTECKSWRQE